jgi:hypothetical protein
MKIYDCKFVYQVIYDTQGELLPLNKYINASAPSDESLTDEIVQEMQNWCTTTFGQAGTAWEYEFVEDAILDIFKFSTEQHRTLFLLKWSI